MSVAELQNMVELPSLIKKSRADDYDGRSAARTIELLLAQLASARRQFNEIHDFGRAAAALELAAGIHPDRAPLWLDLAAERAANGQKGAAVAALHKAFDAGYNDKEALRTDPRFERLRGFDGFDKIVCNAPTSGWTCDSPIKGIYMEAIARRRARSPAAAHCARGDVTDIGPSERCSRT